MWYNVGIDKSAEGVILINIYGHSEISLGIKDVKDLAERLSIKTKANDHVS